MTATAHKTLSLKPLVPAGDLQNTLGPRQTVKCDCGHFVFDGIVVKSRVVRLLPRGGAEALCRCKRWVLVPLSYSRLI